MNAKLKKILTIVLILLPILLSVVCLALGRYSLTIGETVRALLSTFTSIETNNTAYTIVVNLRLPRVILAVTLGAGLACAGAAFQGLFSNPLATPDTLGVTAGAAVGAIVGIMFDKNLITMQFIALIFGLGTAALTMAVARIRSRTSIVMIILSGVIIAALCNAVLSIIKYTADPLNKLPTITYWLMGSMSAVTYKSLALGLPFVLVGILIIFMLRWRLNILTLSEDEIRASGINVPRIRMAIITASTMITASCVSMCGQVGWVGLLVPHCARMIFGSNNRYVIPASISLGAMFMLMIDTMARTLLPSEIPISILTAIIGAPFFIYLLRKTGGGWK